MLFRKLLALAACLPLVSCDGSSRTEATRIQPLPDMRWDHRPEADEWTGATLAAIRTYGGALPATVPSDIERFCPGYPTATMAERRAFWAGLFSALAKHESTWRPEASGGGGQWLGLLQIAPATARNYGCRADTRAKLFDGSLNLSCGVRIAAYQVGRDEEIVGEPGAWRGMARDWAPFRSEAKVADMAAWTRSQEYCRAN